MRLYRAICSWIQSITRINNAHAAILERPDPKPQTEVLATLPEELTGVLSMARNDPRLRGKLPPHIQRILEEEEMELEA